MIQQVSFINLFETWFDTVESWNNVAVWKCCHALFVNIKWILNFLISLEFLMFIVENEIDKIAVALYFQIVRSISSIYR